MELSNQNEQFISSREIAEMAGKQHNDILKSIRKQEVAWEKVNGGKFTLVEYLDSKGEKRPEYMLTKKESLYIGTKFNDEARAKLVIRWEELETNTAKPAQNLSRIELAQMVIDAELEKEKLIKENNRMQERTQFVDTVFNADELLTGSQVCKVLQLPYGNRTLYKKLRESGIFFKNRNEPKQEFVDRGYFKMKEILISEHVRLQTYFTQKGLGYISKFTGVVKAPLTPIKLI